MGCVVSEFPVNLVGNDNQVAFAREGRYAFQIGVAHDCAGRIIRKIEHQDFGPGCGFGFKHGPSEPKTVFRFGLDGEWHAVRKEDRGAVRHVARFVIEHFIPGIEKRPQGQVECLTDTDGDQDLIFGVVFSAETRGDVLRQRATQFDVPIVAGVVGCAAF